MEMLSFYLPRGVTEHTRELRKNGWDVLFLLCSMSVGGKVRNVHPGVIAAMANLHYQQVKNGLDYLLLSGLITFVGDDITLNHHNQMFKKGNGGYFAVHRVFAGEDFIKNVSERGKRLALNVLSKGLGAKTHKKAYTGWRYKVSTIMRICGVDRPNKLNSIITSLQPYFIFDFTEAGYVTIKVKKQYLVKGREVNNYFCTINQVYHMLSEAEIFIRSKKDLNDILKLCRRYSAERVNKIFEQVKYSYQNAFNLGGWLHSIILTNS